MMKKILITTGNGMFGRALIGVLQSKDVQLRIMVRDRSKLHSLSPNTEIVTGDMDVPESLDPIMEGIDAIFLSSPMDNRIAEREMAVITEAKKHGVGHIVKIGGAVRHEDDMLARMHGKVIDFIGSSGIPFTLISPNSVMETSFLANPQSIKYMHAIYGISGHGKIGLVALKDIAEATAHVLTTPGHEGRNYEITGPTALDLYEAAEIFTQVLQTRIRYIDLDESRFTNMLKKYDKSLTTERLETEVLCHLRAWKNGKADLVTQTFTELTGHRPTSMEEFISENRIPFTKNMLPAFMAWMFRQMLAAKKILH
jgi:NAD(P)H dehydrogenase (quinone)